MITIDRRSIIITAVSAVNRAASGRVLSVVGSFRLNIHWRSVMPENRFSGKVAIVGGGANTSQTIFANGGYTTR